MTHSFVVHIPDAELEPEPLDPEQIVSGTPEVTGKVVWESADGRQVRGIWQITPGVVTDTEADELFVVISGSATIEVQALSSNSRRPPGGRAWRRLVRAIARRRSALVAEPRGRFGNAASVRARRRQAGGSSTTGPGGGPTLTVGPGDMAVLRAGDRTTWTVHETLRKAYAISL